MAKGNMGNILKQAQQMQQRVSVLQKELEERELEVSSAGDAVKILINGKQEILSLKINPDCIDPSDPESSKLSLSLTSIAIGIKPRFGHCIFCRLKCAAPGTIVAFGLLDDFPMTTMSWYGTICSWHFLSSP